MTINLPVGVSAIIFSAIGFLVGVVVTRIYVSFVAYCDVRQPPRFIPWRTKPCEGCLQEGYHYGFNAATKGQPFDFTMMTKEEKEIYIEQLEKDREGVVR